MLVTNQHVMSSKTATGAYVDPTGTEKMYQGGRQAADQVGTNLAYVSVVSNKDNLVDIAACELVKATGLETRFYLHKYPTHSNRKIVAGTKEPLKGMKLKMMGATSRESAAVVREVGRRKKFSGSWFDGVLQLAVSPRALGGDSGAACFFENEDGNYQTVCIVFAGERDPNESDQVAQTGAKWVWAFPASAAEEALNISFGPVPPNADAGEDQTARPRATVTLDGSGSSDPGKEALTYHWDQDFGSAGGALADPGITLSDNTSVRPTFTAPDLIDSTPRVLTFNLTVKDTFGSTDTDSVTIRVEAAKPKPIPPPEIWGPWSRTGSTRGSARNQEAEEARTSSYGNRQTRWVGDPEPETWGPWSRTGSTQGCGPSREAEEARTSSYGNTQTQWVAYPGPETWGSWTDTGRTLVSGPAPAKEQARTSSCGNRQTRWVPYG